VHPWRAAFTIAIGLVFIVIGIVFAVAPVLPGFILIILGLALIASRWKTLAWLLDQAELWIHRKVAKFRSRGSDKA
jgi:uncharacterized membrane protein YbaN (DUF454 family)